MSQSIIRSITWRVHCWFGIHDCNISVIIRDFWLVSNLFLDILRIFPKKFFWRIFDKKVWNQPIDTFDLVITDLNSFSRVRLDSVPSHPWTCLLYFRYSRTINFHVKFIVNNTTLIDGMYSSEHEIHEFKQGSCVHARKAI